MTTLDKSPTLRQFTTLLARYIGRKASTYPYVRALQQAGHAELGKPGRGGAKSPRITVQQAALLLIAVSTGSPAKEAIAEAEIFADMTFENATRTFTGAEGSCTLPLNLDGAERLEGLRFGDWVETLLTAYSLGLSPQHFHIDNYTAPYGIRFGQGERGAFGIYERRSLTPNADGHIVHDQLTFGRAYALPPRSDAAQRNVFLPISLIKRVGELLEPPLGMTADEVLDLRDEQLGAKVVGFGGVGSDFPGATVNFPTPIGRA
jgi:hypothetical protein